MPVPTGEQLPVVQRDSLAHADEPVAGGRRLGERSGSLIGGAGVGDLDQDTVGPVLDAQRRVGRPGVADDVGQGLLGDAVGREIDFGGQGPGRPVDVEAQVDPGQPDLFGQGGDVAQTGGRGQGRVRVVLVSQHFTSSRIS